MQPKIFDFPSLARLLSIPGCLGFFFLVGLDLGTKYCISQELRFHLNNRQQKIYRAENYLKQAMPAEITSHEWLPLIGSGGRLLRLRLVFNDKFIFSQGVEQRHGGLWSALFSLLLLYLIYWRLLDYFSSRTLGLGWFALLSGASANFIDRLFIKSLLDKSWHFSTTHRRGYISGVTDFIDMIWFDIDSLSAWPGGSLLAFDRWPVYNIADSLILAGLFCLAFGVISSSQFKKN